MQKHLQIYTIAPVIARMPQSFVSNLCQLEQLQFKLLEVLTFSS